MEPTYKPEGHNSLSPYLIVPEAQKLIDFIVEVFRAKELRRYEHEDGTVMHAELLVDDSVVMISNGNTEWPGNKHMLHVYVPNVDEVYQRAVDLGCKALEEPQTKDGDPDRRGMFEDFAGNQWAVGTQNNA